MQWIQAFRVKNDPNYSVVDPHFTLVFGIRDVDEDMYFDHISSVVKNSKVISFVCKYAMLGADDVDDTAYVFLVPNEGNAEISLLHDKLYRGILEPYHRLEFPYIPHISIAATHDFKQAKALCDQLNAASIHIEGQLSSLSLTMLRNDKLYTLRSFPLAT